METSLYIIGGVAITSFLFAFLIGAGKINEDLNKKVPIKSGTKTKETLYNEPKNGEVLAGAQRAVARLRSDAIGMAGRALVIDASRPRWTYRDHPSIRVDRKEPARVGGQRVCETPAVHVP